ncbi:hypothetical protein GGF50DRAFT_118570 [Schizophyllum commune]
MSQRTHRDIHGERSGGDYGWSCALIVAPLEDSHSRSKICALIIYTFSYNEYVLQHHFIPKHLRPFVQPSVRRLYLNAREDTTNRIKALERDKQQLLASCERHMGAAARHREGERVQRTRAQELEEELQSTKDRLMGIIETYDERLFEMQRKVRALEMTVQQKEDDLARMRTSVYSVHAEANESRGERKKRKIISPVGSATSEDEPDEPPVRRARKSLPRRAAPSHPIQVQDRLSTALEEYYKKTRSKGGPFVVPIAQPPSASQIPCTLVPPNRRKKSKQQEGLSGGRADASTTSAPDRSVEAGPSTSRRTVYIVSDSSDNEAPPLFGRTSTRQDHSPWRVAPQLSALPKRRRVERVDDSDSFDSENDMDDDLSEMYPGRIPMLAASPNRSRRF